jgi:hypothetical protein
MLDLCVLNGRNAWKNGIGSEEAEEQVEQDVRWAPLDVAKA